MALARLVVIHLAFSLRDFLHRIGVSVRLSLSYRSVLSVFQVLSARNTGQDGGKL